MPDPCPRCLGTGRRLPGGLCARCLLGDALVIPPLSAPGGMLGVEGHRVEAEIARGGMGVVYRAVQADPPREVALKMLRPQALDSPELLVRFRQEARTLASLEHPAILPIYESGELDGLPWFTMKLATGGTLAERRDRYAGDWRAVASLLVGLAEAVQFAHEHGVLHRDLKPGNVLFDDLDRAYVADFGLARALASDSSLTRTVSVLGTPHYLAPEVISADARAATTASDQYALGAILYELLAGRPPFEAEGIAVLMRRIVDTEPLPPSRHRPGVPRDLEVVCLKALSKDPARRYGSVREFGADLTAWLQGLPIQARPMSRAETAMLWARRNPGFATAVFVALLLVVGLVAAEFRSNRRLTAAGTRLRDNLYAADMALAATALERDDLDAARRLLARHRPERGAPDLRGLEWGILSAAAEGDSPGGFTGHTATVVAVSPSPDGQTVASASWDGTVQEWDATTFRVLRRWSVGEGHQWFALARLPGLDRLVAVDAVRTGAMVIDLKDGSHRVVPAPPSQALVPMPSGEGLLTQTEARFWSVDGSMEWRDPGMDRPRTLPGTGRRAAFSPDGRRLATGTFGDRLRLWRWPSMEVEGELGPVGPVVAMRFSPDGSRLVSAGFNGELRLWDPSRRVVVAGRNAHGGTTLGAAAFSPDGRLLATAGGDHVLRVWDAATLEPRQVLRGPADQVWDVAWSPDGRRLYSTTRNQGVRQWPVDPERIVRNERVFQGNLLEFTSSGTALLVEEKGGGGIRLVGAGDRSELARLDGPVVPLGLSTDRGTLYLLDEGSAQIRRVSANDLRPLAAPPVDLEALAAGGPPPLRHRFDANSGILAEQRDSGEIRIWNVADGRLLPPLEDKARCDCEFWVLPGGVIALIGDAFAIELHDARSGRRLARLQGHRAPPSSIELSADRRWLATGDEGGVLRLWEYPSLKLREEWDEFDSIGPLRFSGDGRTLLVSDFRRIHFLHLGTGRVAGSLAVESLVHNTLALAPGARAVALIGRDDRLVLWKAAKD